MKTLIYVIIFLALVAVFFFTGIPSSTSTPVPIPVGSTSTPAPIVTAKNTTPTPDNPAPALTGNGSLKGTAKYDGDPPAPTMFDIPEKDHENCAHKAVEDESLVVDKANKGLKWVIVRIMDANPKDEPPKPATPYTMTQKGCAFTPHVALVAPNTDLMILNPDKMLHNIHTTPFDSNDQGQNPAVTTDFIYKAKWLVEPDLIKIECNIHAWMKGYILCHDPRYCAVTAADGTFEIKDLPAGKYKINVWHEKFGNYLKKELIDIEIKPGVATDLGEMKFKPKK